VQPCTVLTIREMRESLHLSQRAFADLLGCAIRSVINWEQETVLPSRMALIRIRAIARAHGLTKTSGGPVPLMYDPVKMERYLGMPSAAGVQWNRLSYAQRASWWAHRARYRRLRADAEAGRVTLQAQPVVALLDSSPDLWPSRVRAMRRPT
jgi:transcriptional regulator with XRE-family HTH domain